MVVITYSCPVVSKSVNKGGPNSMVMQPGFMYKPCTQGFNHDISDHAKIIAMYSMHIFLLVKASYQFTGISN